MGCHQFCPQAFVPGKAALPAAVQGGGGDPADSLCMLPCLFICLVGIPFMVWAWVARGPLVLKCLVFREKQSCWGRKVDRYPGNIFYRELKKRKVSGYPWLLVQNICESECPITHHSWSGPHSDHVWLEINPWLKGKFLLLISAFKDTAAGVTRAPWKMHSSVPSGGAFGRPGKSWGPEDGSGLGEAPELA